MIIDGKTTRPAKVRRNGSRSYNIIITEGMNRQIRKMAGKVHCNVLNLKRIRIGSVFAKGIGPGEWRDLSEDEIKNIQNLDFIELKRNVLWKMKTPSRYMSIFER